MEIVVESKGMVERQPDVIKIRLTFEFNQKTYDKALEIGTNSFEAFVENILPKIKLKRDDIKTNSFSIDHQIDEDYRTNKKIDKGYNFRQIANIEMDYSKDIINIFMSESLKSENIPEYYLTFDIKDKESAKKEALRKAFETGKEKAELIAIASDKKLKECKRTDFKQIGNIHSIYEEGTKINGDNNLEIPSFIRKKKDIFSSFTESFEPEKIIITETMYSLWIAD